jgi:hypothetical protein
MKIGTIFIFIFSIIIFFTGCNSTKAEATNNLKITRNDEKVILEYLDMKTKDIANSSKGKMYSTFKLLGTDDDRIYIWLVKKEYLKKEGQNTPGSGSVVSLPVVLFVNKGEKGISITSHNTPPDGANFGKAVSRLFPTNIREKFPDSDAKDKLVETTLIRATEDFLK